MLIWLERGRWQGGGGLGELAGRVQWPGGGWDGMGRVVGTQAITQPERMCE